MFGSRTRKRLPCLKLPMLMRLAVLWMLQVWYLILVRAEADASGTHEAAEAVPDAYSQSVKAQEAYSVADAAAASAASEPRSSGVAGGGILRQRAAASVDHLREKEVMEIETDKQFERPEPPKPSFDQSASQVAQLPAQKAESLTWSPKTMSVVLPCAGEGQFALRTVESVFESTPQEVLLEIVVVDDGSSPPLTDAVLGAADLQKYRVRVVRHEVAVGLIGAKKAGGDAAKGDLIVFFDCHVAPQPGWYKSFLRLSAENYRRIIVPVITDLDIDTWTQRGGSKGNAKCYLTWDADFKWFESDDDYVPVLSGGLLGISQRWWKETGGYDEVMKGWGGENLDQSLRAWLCGGEILMAKEAQVAHMWRVASDPRTQPMYTVAPGVAHANRMRAAVAWFGEFSEKLAQFPSLMATRKKPDGSPWFGNVDNILEVKNRLQCKSFAWFMHRFKHVYEDGGLIPKETFAIRNTAPATSSCLTYLGQAGTSPDGRGQAALQACRANDDRQRWHGGNRDTSKEGRPCCSGVRAWNTDQCIVNIDGSDTVKLGVCDVSGQNRGQLWELTADGILRQKVGGFMSSSTCFFPDADGVSIRSGGCHVGTWTKHEASEPRESILYTQALAHEGEPSAV